MEIFNNAVNKSRLDGNTLSLPEIIPSNELLPQRFAITAIDQLTSLLAAKQIPPYTCFELINSPTASDIQFIATAGLTNEFAIDLTDFGTWIVIKGGREATPFLPSLEGRRKVWSHFHQEDAVDADLPSPGDMANSNRYGMDQFIVHPGGITRFGRIAIHPVTGEPWNPTEHNEVWDAFFAYVRANDGFSSITKYQMLGRQFHEALGVNVLQKTWSQLEETNPFGF